MIAVEIVIDGDEPGVKQWEHPLDEVSGFDAVSPKSRKIFDNDAVNLIGPNQFNQFLDFGTLKICPAISVVDKFQNLCVSGLRHGRNELVQHKVLVLNAHAVVFVILQGKTDI